MASVNEITLIGNLGADAEEKTMTTGKVVTNFSVATSESRQVNGAWETTTEWHRVTLWNAAYLTPRLKKGAKVYVKGKLKSNEFNGAKYWQIIASVVKPLDRDDSPRPYESPQDLLDPEPPSAWGSGAPPSNGGWG